MRTTKLDSYLNHEPRGKLDGGGARFIRVWDLNSGFYLRRMLDIRSISERWVVKREIILTCGLANSSMDFNLGSEAEVWETFRENSQTNSEA